MSRQQILYVGQSVADNLWNKVEANLDRYLVGNFEDHVAEGNWSIPLQRDFDPEPLKHLVADNGLEVELANSKLVWQALSNLTPSLACENRLWVRLSHIECLEFCRNRWLTKASTEANVQSVKAHFFAATRTAARDEHAISRLWWNFWIARQVRPENPESVLRLMLRFADVRLTLVERPWVFARPPLAEAIIRIMEAEMWLLARERNFREFAKALNLLGGGVAFEQMTAAGIDVFLHRCMIRAQARLAVEERVRSRSGPEVASAGSSSLL